MGEFEGVGQLEDYSRQLAFIAQCDDPPRLRIIMKHAKDLGAAASEVSSAAFRRIAHLVPGVQPGTLEHDFWSVINAFEEVLRQERGRTTRLTRTRQKVQRVGIVQTLQDWATGAKTEGFDMLIERGMPELTGEAVILRHLDRFNSETCAAAEARLNQERTATAG